MENDIENKTIMAKNIRHHMALQGLSRADVCDALKLKYSTFSDWINGKKYPRIDKIEMMANYFHVSKADLVEDRSSTAEKHSSPSYYSYPVIGEVAAGFGSSAIEEETGDYEQIPVDWIRGDRKENFFVLRVKGDSMYPDFRDGDHVLVHRQSAVDSGTIAVVLYESEMATLKKVNYSVGESWLELEPLNREYAPKRIEGAELEQCKILGKVKRLMRVMK